MIAVIQRYFWLAAALCALLPCRGFAQMDSSDITEGTMALRARDISFVGEEIDVASEILLEERDRDGDGGAGTPESEAWRATSECVVSLSSRGIGSVADSLLLGDVRAVRTRVRLWSGRLVRGSLACTKHAGERWKDAASSVTIALAPGAVCKTVLVGDYAVNAGQGLVFSRGMPWHGEGVDRVMATNEGIKPFGGFSGAHFLRGAALTLHRAFGTTTLRFSPFGSYRTYAGTVTEAGTISSIDWSGIVQTSNDASKRNAVAERLAGVRASILFAETGSVGATWYRSTYSREIAMQSSTGFVGSESSAGGIDGSVVVGPSVFFGEIARNRGSTSGIFGVACAAGEKSRVALVARSYGLAFCNLHAFAPGIHDQGANEQGMVFAWSVNALQRLFVDASVDLYRFPGTVGKDVLPMQGCRAGIKCTFTTGGAMMLMVRSTMRRSGELRNVEQSDGTTARRRVDVDRLGVSAVLHLRVARDLTLRHSVAVVGTQYGGTFAPARGTLMTIGCLHDSQHLRLEIRAAVFDASAYAAAVADAEPAVDGSSSAIQMYGKGLRVLFTATWRPLKGLTASGQVGSLAWSWKPAADGDPILCHWPAESTASFGVRVDL